MSKEKDTNHNPSNVVAKLMGLEEFPGEETNLAMERRSIKKDYPQHLYGLHLGSPFNKEMPMLHEFHHASTENVFYKDIYEMWLQKSRRIRSYVRDKKNETQESELEDVVGGKIALIHQKYMDAKRMSSDERLRNSKRFEDAMDVFCSNSVIKLLDEVHCDPASPTETNNISLLKPSNIVDNDNAGMRKKSSGMIMKPENVDENKNSAHSSSESKEVIDEFPVQCTRIVALNPSCGEINELVFPTTPSSRNFQSEPETLCSSILSNVGDESSYKKAEHDDLCAGGNVYSHESVVYKEAKKRISERWTMMASNIKLVQEQKHMKRNSTLGEMLSLSHIKKSEAKFVSSSDSSIDEEINIRCSPKTLPTMSCYVTVSSSDDDVGIGHGSKLVTKSKSVKLSLKGKVMSFLFSMNKKPTKEKSSISQSSVTETSVSSVNSPELLSDDVFQSFNRFEECSVQSVCGSLRKISSDSVSNGKQHGRITPKFGLTVSKTMVPEISSETQDQPSPISVLDTPFEDDNAAHDSLDYMKGSRVHYPKSNLIDRSPPIESIARTLSWNDSCSEAASSYSFKPMTLYSLNTKIEEQEWLFLVEKLLSASGLDDQIQFNSFNTIWHSLESPLTPSLRDKYAYSFNGKDPLHEAMRRKMRSSQKLVFDCVNATILELTSDYGSEKYFSKNKTHNAAHIVQDGAFSPYLVDHIVAQMKKLIASEMRYVWGDCEDSNRLVVENVVRKEVVGIGWDEVMGLEVDILEREIERELIEELVEDAVANFIGRA
ncbi:PREDICTED: uncharacterized protein LOC109332380 isoform X2 [Lupinus angustifolius]|uniref:uncharacterized protein LOC109332380 isoform X2 n=1 Tax=Lupinus angustifolius TaxID=3871 RepID=UPI00092E9FEF|nr:PREDICTED: uncharacterized protein LOC109332380 isoform X2 [Lupinus angustifolius]